MCMFTRTTADQLLLLQQSSLNAAKLLNERKREREREREIYKVNKQVAMSTGRDRADSCSCIAIFIS